MSSHTWLLMCQITNQTHVATTEEVERLMKRCQIGVGGRYALDESHDILAACYGVLGALVQDRDSLLRGESTQDESVDEWMALPPFESLPVAPLITPAACDPTQSHDAKDAKAWARRILQRAQSGERVCKISVEFARQALGQPQVRLKRSAFA